MAERSINIDKTVEKVRQFFDRDFQEYLNRAGKHRTDLSSPKLDPTGVTTHGRNGEEVKLVSNLMWQTRVAAVDSTIKDCTATREKPYRQILYYCYIRQLPAWQVRQKVGFGKTRYGELKNSAMIEFSERLHYWAEFYSVKMPDLTEYDVEDE